MTGHIPLIQYAVADCEDDEDECASIPCENSGTCRDSSTGVIGYRKGAPDESGALTKIAVTVPGGAYNVIVVCIHTKLMSKTKSYARAVQLRFRATRVLVPGSMPRPVRELSS